MQVIFSCKVDYSNKKKVRACLHLCRLKSFKFLFVFLQVIVVFDVLNSGGTPNTSFPLSGIYGVILVSYVPRHLSRPKKKNLFYFPVSLLQHATIEKGNPLVLRLTGLMRKAPKISIWKTYLTQTLSFGILNFKTLYYESFYTKIQKNSANANKYYCY